jgi:hypothetical protein
MTAAEIRAELARRKAALAPGPRTIGELARCVGVNESSLRRALSCGVLAESMADKCRRFLEASTS